MKKVNDSEGYYYIVITYKIAGIFLENINSGMKIFKADVLYEMISFIKELNNWKGVDAKFVIRQNLLQLFNEPTDSSLIFRFKDCPTQFFIMSNDLINENKIFIN